MMISRPFGFFLFLGSTVLSSGFFLPSSIKAGGPFTFSSGFINTDPVPSTEKPDFSVFVLPGTLVPPSSYESVCRQIGSICDSKNITVDVDIAKFAFNVGHRFESESMSEKIKKRAKSDKIVVVGHSASAVVGADIAQKVDAVGFVQWCGTFNSNGDFPWDCLDPYKYDLPIMTILSEHDSLFSFATATREFCNFGNYTNSVIPTSIKDAGHFSGIFPDDREFEELPSRMQYTLEKTGMSVDDVFDMGVASVAWRVSEFIGYLDGSSKSIERIVDMKKQFQSKFKDISRTQSVDDVKAMLYGPDSTEYHTHSTSPPGLLYSLLYAGFPEGRSLLTLTTVILPFIFTYPSKDRSISVSGIVNPLPGAVFSNPSVWAKIPYDGPDNFSREVNSETFNQALSEVSEEDREAYIKHGKPMVFARDTEIAKVPGCGLVWVYSPLVLENKDSYLSVSSPVIRMKDTLNTKLLSKKQCLEWILVGCFK